MAIHNISIDNHYTQKRTRDAAGPILKLSVNRASTERQRCSILCVGYQTRDSVVIIPNGSVGILQRQKTKQHTLCPMLKMSFCRAPTSAKEYSLRAEWLLRGGCALSEPSETPGWRITLCPVTIQRVALYNALQLLFHCFFALCQSHILMITLALWPNVEIRRNGFIGYALASGLQHDV